MGSETEIPERFQQALLSLRDAHRPKELILDEVPPPRRLAPFVAALSAETVASDNGSPLASGRFVVLHDPEGQDGWNGDFRLVVMANARLDDEVGPDPLLGSVAWSWLTDALESSGAGFHDLVGTVTRVLSESFGGLELTSSTTHAEIRASWTPNTPDLEPHLSAWYELLRISAGHEPGLLHPLDILESTR